MARGTCRACPRVYRQSGGVGARSGGAPTLAGLLCGGAREPGLRSVVRATPHPHWRLLPMRAVHVHGAPLALWMTCAVWSRPVDDCSGVLLVWLL